MKNKNMMLEIIKKEIRDIIRDKKTLFTMIIAPLLLYPLMFGFILTLEDSMLSSEGKIGFAFETDETLDSLIEKFKIQKINGTEEELEEKIENKEIDAYITFKNKEFTICFTSDNTQAQIGVQMAYQLIEQYSKQTQAQILIDEGINPNEVLNVYTINNKDISKKDSFAELTIGLIPLFVFMIISLTATLSAVDMTAGEKERGTLETLLTFPLKTRDIIGGKFIATTICSTVSGILGFLSMYGVAYYLTGKLTAFQGVKLLTAQSVFLVIVLFIVYAMLISALSIIFASKAKSFKEAQSSTQLLALLPSMLIFATFLGVEFNSTLALVPFINVQFMLSNIISGITNMQYFALTIISNLVFIWISMKIVVKLYKSDKILFS